MIFVVSVMSFALVPEIKLIPRPCIGVEYQSLEF